MPVRKSSISLYPDIEKRILSRGGLSEVIRRDLTRLYNIYERALRTVELSRQEMCLLVDVLSIVGFDMTAARYLYIVLSDTSYDVFYAKWGVEKEGFIMKASKLSLIHNLAIFDAIERYKLNDDGNIDKVEQYFKEF